jgi:hypothetical protein
VHPTEFTKDGEYENAYVRKQFLIDRENYIPNSLMIN